MNYTHNKWVLLGLTLLLTTMCNPAAAEIQNISALAAKALIQENQSNTSFVILDLRTPAEFAQGHIDQARLLDYTSAQFSAGLERLDKSDTYLIYCRTGNRSGRALKLIERLGFNTVYHLAAGIVSWQAEKLPLVQ